MKNILVMGGTGAMGMYLVPQLVEAGYKVFVTSRREMASDNPNLVYIQGNAKNLDWLENEIHGIEFTACFDFIYHSAEEFKERAFQLLGLSKQYFLISSYRCYSKVSGNLLTEDNPLKDTELGKFPIFEQDRYGYGKAKEESFLRALNRKDWTIIRPTMTFSKNRFQFFFGDNFDVSRAVRRVKTALPESALSKRTNITYGKDVARILVQLVDNELAFGEAFHPVSNDTLTWREIANVYQEVFGLNYVIVPDEEYRLACPDWRTLIDRFLDRPFSNEKVLRVTGLLPGDLGNLKDNLKEAWLESDVTKFTHSQDIVSQPKFDILTDDETDFEFIHPNFQERYQQRIKDEKFGFHSIIGTQFRVDLRDNAWRIFYANDYETVFELDNTNDGQWLMFKFIHPLAIDEKRTVKVSVKSDRDVVIKPFLHFNGMNIKVLDKVNLYAYRKAEISFVIEGENLKFPYSHLSVTSTDFSDLTHLTFYNENVEFIELNNHFRIITSKDWSIVNTEKRISITPITQDSWLSITFDEQLEKGKEYELSAEWFDYRDRLNIFIQYNNGNLQPIGPIFRNRATKFVPISENAECFLLYGGDFVEKEKLNSLSLNLNVFK